jgi:hypothetical protein
MAKATGLCVARRREEIERLEKEKEIWNKENRLSKEEEIKSWTPTIEVLEKIYKHFYSYKDFRLGKFNPSAVRLCQGDYNDEDKAACKKEVMRILKMCKKEGIFINNSAIANLIYRSLGILGQADSLSVFCFAAV